MAEEEPVSPGSGDSKTANGDALRPFWTSPLFHVVLHEPEIPNNTGNIGRTCVATGCALHLVHPLGFDTSEKACRRSGLDYWPRLRVTEHADWPTCERVLGDRRVWVFTTRARASVFSATFNRGDALVFGKETSGLPAEIIERYETRAIGFPMVAGERSLNLATAVCNSVYEGVRQLLGRGEIRTEGGAGLRIVE